ncbi:MAG TPA: folate-binding protein [Methylotenera sp.]|nr:folate-binding protein [Methylotenera sp.]
MTATAWQQSLVTQGATLESGAITHFGDVKNELAATANDNVLCDLNHLGLLEISGTDAVAFLQGQVTNDVKLLMGQDNKSSAHYSAYCNPKGRMLGLFLAFAQHDQLYLQFNRTLLESIMKRLKMYVMRSKVEIKDASDSMIKFGINGPHAASILAGVFSKVPAQDYELLSLDNAIVLKLPSINNHSRFQIITNAENAPLIWNALKTKTQLVGKLCWDWLEIQAGIPDIELATQEQFVPQMLNLDILNGINFKKGCYTGQEIVARTHYLGSVKRRTYLASLDTVEAPKAGEKVLDATQNEVGQIVRTAPNPSNGYDALIEMRIDSQKTVAQQSGSVFWNGVLIETKALPYDIGS